MYNRVMFAPVSRFVRYAASYLVLGAALAATPLCAQKHKKKDTPDSARTFYSGFGYVMGAQLPRNYVPALGRMVFARGAAHESRAFQKSFFIGDAKTPLHPDSLAVFFERWGQVQTFSRNMLLDFRAAKKTVRHGHVDIDNDIVFRNSTDSVAPQILMGSDLFPALGRVANKTSDPKNGYVDIVLTAEGGLAALAHMTHFPPRTRFVTYAAKDPAKAAARPDHPAQYTMQVMNPAIHGVRVDSYYFAEIATVAAPADQHVFVTFVSNTRGAADTVRIGDKIVYGDANPDTPTLYVANIDAVAALFLENKGTFPNKTRMPPKSNLNALDGQLRRARRKNMPYDSLPPDMIRDLRAVAVEFLSGVHGRGPDARYGYEILGLRGSDAFRTYLMRDARAKQQNLTP